MGGPSYDEGNRLNHNRQKSAPEDSAITATRRIELLASRRYDAIVIGGGINGAGIAKAAAQAGLSVLLLEKNDFGWGTTWRSTKLIHGGLRYLEHAEFGLVFHSLRDQRALMRQYPQMVRPLSFLLPVYRRNRHGPFTIGAGLTLYDALSAGRGLPVHRRLSASSARSIEPALRQEGFRAAFTYSDCQLAYPERLCIETILEARDAGAEVINHAEVIGILRSSLKVSGVRVRETESGREFEVESAVVVNATGPWVDQVLEQLPGRVRRQIGGTKGAHLVVDYRGAGPTHAIYAEAGSDHRPFFIVPWRDRHLIGTTDTRFEGSPDDAMADQSDIDYLMAEAGALLPGAPLDRSQVQYAYAGIRPLPVSPGRKEGAITRKHYVRDHSDDGHPGLISIVGGKLSTYPSLARQVVKLLEKVAGPRAPRSVNRTANLKPSAAGAESKSTEILGHLVPARLDYLRTLYGQRTDVVLGVAANDSALMEPLCPHGPDVAAQIVVAARHELARSLSDALMRRTGAGWNACLGLDCAARAATLMGRELRWSEERIANEISGYAAEVKRTFVVPVTSNELQASAFGAGGT